jgi:signal transduction histidine kinase
VRNTLFVLIALAGTFASSSASAKEEFGTAAEAKAMVAKAIQHIQKVGPEKAYQAFTAKDPAFTDRDLYVIVYDVSGRVLAHGQNPKMVGKDNLDLRDADGKPYIRDRIETSKSKSGFWQEYKWTDPVSRKLLLKSTYTERYKDTLISVGVYKR